MKEAKEERRRAPGIGLGTQKGKFECDKVVGDESGNKSRFGSAGRAPWTVMNGSWFMVHIHIPVL